MGSHAAHFGYSRGHSPYPHGHEHLHEQNHHSGLGRLPTAPSFGQPISASNVDLSIRLAVLEKEYYSAQVENAKKEAIIQYLLHSKTGGTAPNTETADTGAEVLSLKKNTAELNKNNEQLRSQLQQALDIIFALSAPIANGLAVQSPKTAKVDLVKTNDLIDLLDRDESSEGAKLGGEETTLLDDFYDDVSENGEMSKHPPPNQSSSASFSSDMTDESSYIRHFVKDDAAIACQDKGKTIANVRLITTIDHA